jgi:integrase
MKENIKELIERFYAEMARLRYGSGALRQTSAILAQIAKLHAKYAKEQLDSNVLEEYIKISAERLARDKIGRAYSRQQVYTAKRLLEFSKTGRLEFHRFQMPRTTLTAYYDAILAEFLEDRLKTVASTKRIAWSIGRYTAWLISQRIDSLTDVSVQTVHKFILDSAKQLSAGSMPGLRSDMRIFCRWALEKGHSIDAFEAMFDFSVAMERKIYPAPLSEEISLVLNSIDRSTAEGKRDYAIIMLGIVTGLRAGDVANLRLSNIDWRNGEIRITQGKTGKPLALPLTQDVGAAISDYILNARPQTESDKIFLRSRAPIQPLASGSPVCGIYGRYRKRLGLTADGFHSLRRALGKNLLTSGTPVTTVAQVLGHSNISNTKQYIALDTTRLKECALDFTGIAPKRGAI